MIRNLVVDLEMYLENCEYGAWGTDMNSFFVSDSLNIAIFLYFIIVRPTF